MGDQGPQPGETGGSDIVAELRGNTSDVAALVGNLYRGEVDRASAWRARLDQTTNWAVVVVAAILTWAFSSPDNPHYVLLIGALAVTGFLLIEAHRFREYDIWRQRVRLIQENLFVGILAADSPRDGGWQAELSRSLDSPAYSMPFRKAVGHRLRRTYLPLLLVLLIAWTARITVFQQGEQWHQTATIPGVDGETVALIVAGAYVAFVAVAVWSARGTEIREFEN